MLVSQYILHGSIKILYFKSYLPNWRKSLLQSEVCWVVMDSRKIENPNASDLRWSSRWQRMESLLELLYLRTWAWLWRKIDCLVVVSLHRCVRLISLYEAPVTEVSDDTKSSVQTLNTKIVATDCFIFSKFCYWICCYVWTEITQNILTQHCAAWSQWFTLVYSSIDKILQD